MLAAACGQILGLDNIDYEAGDGGTTSAPVSDATTAEDALGAHDGTYTGAYTLGVPGALVGDPNTAVSFDGTGFVALPSLGTATDWTIEGWTKLTTSASTHPYGDNSLYAGSPGVRLIIRPAGVHVDDGSNRFHNGEIIAATPTNIDRWVYWALVRSGQTLTVYRNAVAVAHSTLTTPGASDLNGSIGADNGRSYFLHGAVDELAIYTTALSAPTITRHYNLAGYPSG